ncbi:MAG: sulfatase-like hydrolase/transferase, partial [Planctomycetota bacterium]
MNVKMTSVRALAAAFVGVLVFSPLVVDSPEATAGPTEQPNIVFILLDDAGYRDFGAMGSGFILTPSIDAIAQEGITLTQYYASAPLCAPSRGSLLTGHYPARFGVRQNGPGFYAHSTVTLPQMLGAEGYATGHVGKWHVSSLAQTYIPLSAGFDRDVRYRSRLANSSSYFDPFITIDDSEVVHHVGEHLNAVLTDYAIEFIEENATGPFFLQLWHWAPHSPLQPPPEWAALYPDTQKGRYAALLSDADEEIGRLLDRLDTLGIADNTLVLITSDNGGWIHVHGDDPDSEPSNGELRDFKGSMFEGGIRVPLFARWPGMIASDSTNDSVAIGLDLFPTAAEVAGADISSLGLPGKSLVNILLGATESREPLFWELKVDEEFYNSPDGIFDDFAVRQDDWKLVREDDQVMLFDLATDIGEENDVAAANPTIVIDLLAQQSAWRLAEGLISHEIDSIQGDVVVDGDVFTFGGGNGLVTFVNNVFYDVSRGDFS